MRFLLVFALFLPFVFCDTSRSPYYYPDAIESLLNAIKQLNITVSDTTDMCWRDSYGRGVGHVIDSCSSTMEKDGALCYPPCSSGYYGVGPVCWEHCKEGYTDEGALCAINLEIISSDNSGCPWYDKCGLIGAKGCSKCPDSSWINDGCTCRHPPDIYAKKSYGRGAGVPLGCASNEQEDAALCYPLCKSNYNGFGPLCWGGCPKRCPVSIGALCCENDGACTDKVKQMAMAVMAAVAAAVMGGASPASIIDDLKKAIEAILGFVLPICVEY